MAALIDFIVAQSSQHPVLQPSEPPPASSAASELERIVSAAREGAGQTPVAPISRPDPPAPPPPTRVASRASAGLGWVTLIVAVYFYDHAKPVKHSIDGFFGVVRRRDWDEQSLIVALVLGFAALLLATASIVFVYLAPKEDGKEVQPPIGAGILALLGAISVVLFAIRLA